MLSIHLLIGQALTRDCGTALRRDCVEILPNEGDVCEATVPPAKLRDFTATSLVRAARYSLSLTLVLQLHPYWGRCPQVANGADEKQS